MNFKIKRESDWVKFRRCWYIWKKKDVGGGKKRFEREAEDDGFNIYFGVVKIIGVGQGK